MPDSIPHIPVQAQELLNFDGRSVFFLALLFFLGFGLLLLARILVKPRRKRAFQITFLIVYCCLCAISAYTLGNRQEKERRIAWARCIASDRDMDAERNFEPKAKALLRDSCISRLARLSCPPAQKDTLQLYLQKNYLEKVFPGYQFYFTLCQKEEILLIDQKNTFGCREFFQLKAQEGKPSNCPGLSVIDYGLEYYAYLFRLPIPLPDPDADADAKRPDTLFMNVEMGRKKFSDAPGQSGLHLPSSYSYAFYSNNDLWSHQGDFLYSYRLHYRNSGQAEFKNWKGYSHLFLPLDEKRMLILSTPQPDPWEILHNFSLYFLLFGLCGSVLLLLTDRNFLGTAGTYQQRLRASTYVLLLFTFAAFSILSLLFIRQSYRNENIKTLRNQSLSTLAEMESRYLTLPRSVLYDPRTGDSIRKEIYMDLDELADLFRCEICLYSVKGDLLSPMGNGFIPDTLDTRILKGIEQDQSHLYIDRLPVRNGTGGLMSVSPFRNAHNEILGYLYIPYFSSKNEWRSEMNHLLGAYLNVMVLLSILMLLVSYLLARRITMPLSLIAKKVSQISLTRKNEHLSWKRNDEIGSLIKQYNLLLDELESSSRKLAETERESAWNEMARQVAHEIKNPLTPMKLQAQQLQRAYHDRKSDFGERLDRFTAMLTEQIDHLAAIAGTFSQLARWQKPQMQAMDPCSLLEKIHQLYKADEQTDFRIDIPFSARQARIEADPKFLEQILHNFIKNAQQALSEKEEPGSGGKQIHIGIREARIPDGSLPDRDASPYWELYVEDNGPGIEPEKARRIFEPHFTTRSTGAGLGLSICKKLAESMNARIGLDEKRNTGALFFVIFPTARAFAEPDAGGFRKPDPQV